VVVNEAAGFEPPRKVFNLLFEDPALAGLQVKMFELSLGDTLDLVEAADVDVAAFTAADVPKIRQLIGAIAGNIKGWNVQIPLGTPAEPTEQVIAKQGTSMIVAIIKAWFAAMGDVDAPLVPGSPPSLPDLSEIPMQPMPASLAS
jgi:hypothetical protein